jgi:hypothetical protein
MHEASVKVYRHNALENGASMFLFFCMGGLMVASIVVLTSAVPSVRFLFEAHTFGPFSEEVLKFMSACIVLAATRSYGDVYTFVFPMIGTSFGLFEALRHFQVYGEVGLWAVGAHIAFALVMGGLFFAARKSKSYVLYACALLVPIALHVFYNTLVVTYLFG